MTSSFGRAEAEKRGGPAAGPARLTPLAGRLEHTAAHEHALKVRRRDVEAERCGVDVTELAEGERLGREREADVRVRELGPEPLAPGERDRAVVEGELRQPVDFVPVRVLGENRIDAERHDAEVRGRELPLLGMPVRIAPRLELLEV